MKLVITPHRPWWRKALLALTLLGTAVLAVLIAVDYGQWKSMARAMVASGEQQSLLQEVVTLRRENLGLARDNARLRRAAEVDGHARRVNHQRLVELESEVAALSSEVEFYREAVGSVEVDAGPRVNGIRIERLEGDGRYAYRLVMTHVSREDRTAEGSLEVDVRGELDGERKALGFADIVESGPDSLGFKFKHFHLFEGTLRIPDGFVPRQIHLAVRESARGRSVHEQTWDWASVLN